MSPRIYPFPPQVVVVTCRDQESAQYRNHSPPASKVDTLFIHPSASHTAWAAGQSRDSQPQFIPHGKVRNEASCRNWITSTIRCYRSFLKIFQKDIEPGDKRASTWVRNLNYIRILCWDGSHGLEQTLVPSQPGSHRVLTTAIGFVNSTDPAERFDFSPELSISNTFHHRVRLE